MVMSMAPVMPNQMHEADVMFLPAVHTVSSTPMQHDSRCRPLINNTAIRKNTTRRWYALLAQIVSQTSTLPARKWS